MFNPITESYHLHALFKYWTNVSHSNTYYRHNELQSKDDNSHDSSPKRDLIIASFIRSKSVFISEFVRRIEYGLPGVGGVDKFKSGVSIDRCGGVNGPV